MTGLSSKLAAWLACRSGWDPMGNAWDERMVLPAGVFVESTFNFSSDRSESGGVTLRTSHICQDTKGAGMVAFPVACAPVASS